VRPELDAVAEVVVETIKDVVGPMLADLAATKAALAATETALAALQATIALTAKAETAATLDRRVEALAADVGGMRERVAAVEVKTLQPGPPGPPGKDGVDGMGFDDLDCVDDGSGVALQFRRGDEIKSFPLPVPYDRGTFKPDETYRKGNCVNDGGYWTAKAALTGIRPGMSPQSWRLLVHPKSFK
jgi:hypothetical protein